MPSRIEPQLLKPLNPISKSQSNQVDCSSLSADTISKVGNKEPSTTRKAQYAMLSRLLTCLVNEHLAHAYIQEEGPFELQFDFYWCSLKLTDQNNQDSPSTFWFQVKKDSMPLMNPESPRQVGLLDPDDVVMPIITKKNEQYEEVLDCQYLMKQITTIRNLDAGVVDKLTKELESSCLHQDYAYRRNLTTLPMEASAIDWEQSIVEGHPTHPMNKARYAVEPISEIDPSDYMLFPKIHFFAVSKNEATILGDYDNYMKTILLKSNDSVNFETESVIPVHEVQIPNILEKFPQARQLNHIESARAQASIRTVVLDSMPHLNFKLAIGIKITSAMRTITPWTTFVGPHFKVIADAINDDKETLKVVDEVGSASINHPDPDVAKHFSCIIREDAEFCCPKEKVIVAAALVEKDAHGKYILPKIFGLDTEQARVDFFRSYASLYLKAFATPIFKYGMTYEAHLQNVLARFQLVDGKYQVAGFVVRDFGGIQVHAPTLLETTGLTLPVWNQEACQLAQSLHSLHHVAFHTMIQMHLHRIIRSLGLHYNGLGWRIVYDILDQILPSQCLTREDWLQSPTADAKSFIKMKLEGLYRDYLYTPIPNLITYYQK